MTSSEKWVHPTQQKKVVCFSRNLIHPLLPSFFQGFKSSVCQQCAKITRTAGAYTECCDNVSNAYVWCKRLYDFTNPLGWFDSQRSTKLAKLIYPSVLDNHRSSCTSHFLGRRRENWFAPKVWELAQLKCSFLHVVLSNVCNISSCTSWLILIKNKYWHKIFYFLWKRSMQSLQLQLPSGGSLMGGTKQYMWYPLSQSSQKRSWSSFSLVPHRVQHLHSMHCQGYSLTEMIMLWVNCRQVGCPRESTCVK